MEIREEGDEAEKTSFNAGMKNLVTTINKLHDALASTHSEAGQPTRLNLELPQIAVIGGQSAGKSSVLESVAGRDILPRGEGIVTRRPLILQMIPSQEEFMEFLHQPNKPYTSYEEVRKEIRAETEKEVTGKAISSKPIRLRLYSPDVLQLTLVDLPGMTKVPVGNQPDNIEKLIQAMILEYIQPENTLILAVTSATEDLANSDALKLARLVDPKGERTIAVLTKLDLMDRGTDARKVLENKVYPLKRGYIGVVNRSQKDVEAEKDMKAAREDEEAFFEAQPAYSDLLHQVGTRRLQQVLNEEFEKHIKEKLPEFRSKILQQKVMKRFTKRLEACLKGFDDDVDIHEVQLGAVINQKINEKIIHGILNEENLVPTNEETRTALTNLVGIHNYTTGSQQAFQRLVKHMAKKFLEPIKTSVDLIAEFEIRFYPNLKLAVLSRTTEIRHADKNRCKKRLVNYIEAECAFVNTNHPSMRRGRWSSRSGWSTPPPNPKTDEPSFHQGSLFIGAEPWRLNITRSRLHFSKSGMQRRLNNGDIQIGVKNDYKKCAKTFIITWIDDGFPWDENALIMEAVYDGTEGKEVGEQWESKFKEAGIHVVNLGETDPGGSPSFPNHELNSDADQFINEILKYMRIVKQTIQDLTPKFIVLELIDRLMVYIEEKLQVQIQKGNDMDELMKPGGGEELKRRSLLREYEMTEEALGIINGLG
ncbi:unnamed protein product [Darwinula stevensoni]|uniref:dynamin GTPase n=1 Tax=Darwinula stevensoni TaxID=69355 RepID=A0A7R8XGR0_9CRUS|nr:unnamed protein product [Darwinula stevensoni]CAG0891731.1 unnamed protein product [Darwinula stevensoni]